MKIGANTYLTISDAVNAPLDNSYIGLCYPGAEVYRTTLTRSGASVEKISIDDVSNGDKILTVTEYGNVRNIVVIDVK